MPANANLGANEVIELSDVLSQSITNINTIQLYNEHCKDAQLKGIVDKQLNFMTDEYNRMVQSINQQGMGEAVPYKANMNYSPTYGLRKPAQETPNPSPAQIDDHDVASALVTIHKTSASRRMTASLESANPQIRRMLIQSAINCADQAYDVWQYMNSRGYYQVPTLQQKTTDNVLNSYQPM